MQQTKFGQDLLRAIPEAYVVMIVRRNSAEQLGYQMRDGTAAQVFATPHSAVLAIDSKYWNHPSGAGYFKVRQQYQNLRKVAHEFGHILRAIEFPELVAAQHEFDRFLASPQGQWLAGPGAKIFESIPGMTEIAAAIRSVSDLLDAHIDAMKEETEAYAEEVAGRILSQSLKRGEKSGGRRSSEIAGDQDRPTAA
jgi:hypothetical protein